MNEKLEIKKVPFLGTELVAVRDTDGQIWAGVRWMCSGIGLSKAQGKTQVEKINEDKVLSKGVGNFRLPTGGGMQDSFCLKLDYVPLWLAKIAITPKMEKETPELAAKLEQYQLKAKDVLAAAFLPQVKQAPAPSPVKLRDLTTDDYINASRIIADCRNERLPYVIGLLEMGGFVFPKVESAARVKPPAKMRIEKTRTILDLDDFL